MNLVIVESPAKAKTINKYLGNDYNVLASFGHVRDLPSKMKRMPKKLQSLLKDKILSLPILQKNQLQEILMLLFQLQLFSKRLLVFLALEHLEQCKLLKDFIRG